MGEHTRAPPRRLLISLPGISRSSNHLKIGKKTPSYHCTARRAASSGSWARFWDGRRTGHATCVRVSVRDRHWIEAQKMEAFLAVARGSCEAPVFIECQYNAGSSTAPVLLAAKGIAFDCGGLCLKAASEMSENRGSMAGAAAVLGAMYAVALAKAPLNVNAVIPVCENMVSGQCMKVGDVVTALNGLTIQVMYKPSLVIDVATLTHGILLATGGGAFGCFSNSEALWRALQHAGSLTGDRGWRFPLWHYYRQHIHSDPAVDILNRGSGNSTPCIGAAFLQNFICGDWLHLDITGVGKFQSTLDHGAVHRSTASIK
ncbi:unnamed protein product [Leptidea sinapis]|uniref:Cytosol aminopeptidase domain-containing protein n=1 Tax=Leptidea sinapis TaxID=189913 RepID=A0A5E4QIP7_9NEOP|nr:unnamed protein product [Leptidea sinapis]